MVHKTVLSRSSIINHYDISYLATSSERETSVYIALLEIGALSSSIIKVRVLSQQTNLLLHARRIVSIVVCLSII